MYALVALGFSMVYGILKLLNFAHGDVMMVGAFVGWGILSWLGGAQNPSVAVWLLIVVMAVGAMVACGGSASCSSASPTGRCARRRGLHR